MFRFYTLAFRPRSYTAHIASFLRKRYSSLSFIAAVGFAVQFLDISLWLFVYTDFTTTTTTQAVLIAVASTLHISAQFVITLCLTLRFWLVHYQILVEMMSESHEWKKIINANYQQEESYAVSVPRPSAGFDPIHAMQSTMASTEWILAHRSTLGNQRWLTVRSIGLFATILMVIVADEICRYLVPQHVLQWLQFIFAILIYGILGALISVLLFLQCRSPQFSDSIFIKKELRKIFQIFMCCTPIFVIYCIVFGLRLSDSNIYDGAYFNEILVMFHAIALTNLAMIYITTYYPLTKARVFTQHDTEKSVSKTELSVSSKKNKVKSKTKREDDAGVIRRIKLDSVLRNKYGYDAFIQHLSKEFSMENLLALTEFLQFKRYIFDKYKHSVESKELYNWFHMLPLDDMPRSEIVYAGEPLYARKKNKRTKRFGSSPSPPRPISPHYVEQKLDNDDNEDDDEEVPDEKELQLAQRLYDDDDVEFVRECKWKAHQLYVKYVRPGAQWEINIAWDLRQNLRALLDDEQRWLGNPQWNELLKLRDLFDKCCDVTRRLMNQSLTRFKNSDKFNKIKQEVIKEANRLSVHGRVLST